MKTLSLREIYERLNAQYFNLEHSLANPSDLQEMVSSFNIACNDLELDWHTEQESTIRIIPLIDWICTDAVAGIQAIGNGKEIIGFRSRVGRKYDWDYEWISLDCFDELKSELNQFQIKPDPVLTIADLDWIVDLDKYDMRLAAKRNLALAEI